MMMSSRLTKLRPRSSAKHLMGTPAARACPSTVVSHHSRDESCSAGLTGLFRRRLWNSRLLLKRCGCESTEGVNSKGETFRNSPSTQISSNNSPFFSPPKSRRKILEYLGSGLRWLPPRRLRVRHSSAQRQGIVAVQRHVLAASCLLSCEGCGQSVLRQRSDAARKGRSEHLTARVSLAHSVWDDAAARPRHDTTQHEHNEPLGCVWLVSQSAAVAARSGSTALVAGQGKAAWGLGASQRGEVHPNGRMGCAARCQHSVWTDAHPQFLPAIVMHWTATSGVAETGQGR